MIGLAIGAFAALVAAAQETGLETSALKMFRTWNSDKDDVLSRQEWQGNGTTFLQFDSNHDAYLSLEELLGGSKNPERARRRQPKPPDPDSLPVAIGNFSGPAPEWFQQACNKCHDSSRILAAVKDVASWEETVLAMQAKDGAGLLSREARRALRFLLAERQKIVDRRLESGALDAEREWSWILQHENLHRFDRDRDQTLASNELNSLLMAQLDFDGDRFLSLGEYRIMPVGWDRVASFRRVDENGDGRISSRELGVPESLMLVADADLDGALSSRELPRVANGPARVILTRDVDEMFAHLDRNGDGELSRREIEIEERLFARANADGDGELNRDELELAIQRARAIGIAATFDNVIDRYDADRNRKLTAVEFPGSPLAFQRFDTNGDQTIDSKDAAWDFSAAEFHYFALEWRLLR